jgi:phospholipid N-methyltransferase
LNSHVDFLRESFRNLRLTGSVARSSRFLCKAMADAINPADARVVVELGAGDGAITRFLLRRICPEAHLYVFEINPVFVEKLKHTIQDSRICILPESAENMGALFSEREIESVDYIVSAIPFALLPEVLADSIVDACYQWLRPGGKFIQYHYSPHLFGLYKQKFGNIHVQFIPWNIPPAFVVSCVKS